MSPISQFASVATITFAVLGFQTIAFIGLGLALALMLVGFVTPLIEGRPAAAADSADPPPPPEPTPNDIAIEKG